QKLTERLSQEKEHDITIVDLNPEPIEELVNLRDVMGVCGSCGSIDTLMEAGAAEADLLIAVTKSDELNLLTCLMAQKVGNCQTIARVRKPEYSKALSFFKDDFGLAMIINPEHAAAKEMASVLRFPSAIQIDSFARGRVEILKFRISEDSVLNNMQVSKLAPKLHCDILVCGVERGEDAFIPRGDFILKSGDLVSIISTIKNAADFFKKIGVKTNRVKDTIIVGGGETAYYLSDMLLQAGIDVKIIEQNAARCEELCDLLPKATIIHGDGTDNRLLLEEGLERTESFVALTNIDEENILLSLFAKSKTNAKLVTKINRIAYDEVIDNLHLDTMVYPKNITAEYIVRYVRAMKNSIGSNIETLHYILGNKAEALEFRIRENSPIAGTPIEKLRLKSKVLIACINRGGHIIIPRGRDIIKPRDTVIIVTTESGFKDVSDVLD
ncbi:MAG: Trk system potassium transporter TrkA, partial [Clostridia bacterium]|nr:Trk system potassium transporter TrkA [Clostridia bacterium]